MTCSGWVFSHKRRKSSLGYPSMLNSAEGNLSSISARRAGRSEKRIWRWSGRGCTVSPLAPASSAICPKCATSGHGRSRRLRNMAIAFRLTESFAGMASGSGSELTSCFTQVDADRKEADKFFIIPGTKVRMTRSGFDVAFGIMFLSKNGLLRGNKQQTPLKRQTRCRRARRGRQCRMAGCRSKVTATRTNPI
ncbi:conserved hypothetical protein [Agrobacterium genomosp. 2 str. CFBP 5494]|uniref:Uncharacterized protein n=1 Tax=Agrobacterium genomosp. 2 str. CFBP 5494 TaxID=1183436 RepID=A0A9W5AZQ8_9HYPH|nr:conserved hypothetical protein [Agrobacterium genomosp. 2 str. CFBP 5494]